MTIKDWPISERPREKLLEKGASSLTDAELLALLFRVGVRGQDAVSLARACLTQAGGLMQLLGFNRERFTDIRGMGDAKYVLIQASMELSRRFLQSEMTKSSFFKSSDAAKRFFRARLVHEEREVFIAAFLNSQHQLLSCEQLFTGTINAAHVHAREVVKAALRHNAASLVLAHNHPSGSLEPSQSDIDLTRHLRHALTLVDVTLLDHIIVGNGVVSMADMGLIEY